VIIHPQCHKPGTAGNTFFEKCLIDLEQHEGLISVCDWLEEMEQYYPQTAKEARMRVEMYQPIYKDGEFVELRKK